MKMLLGVARILATLALMAPAMALANLIVTPNSISGITVVQNDTAMASASVTESGTTNYYEITPSGSGAQAMSVSHPIVRSAPLYKAQAAHWTSL